ncbi:MAG: archease [Candidatus Promineifilaceae bacterium]|nr:archease [Candidatus Promineifilaceae bacterium]
MELASEQSDTDAEAYQVVDHTADWALRVRGATLGDLLVNAALGMASLLVEEPTAIPLNVERSLEIYALDAETLLVDWLSELAYWAESEQLLFREFELIEVTVTHLEGQVRGGVADQLTKHIKAVTYHNLEIIETSEGLEATIVFDV